MKMLTVLILMFCAIGSGAWYAHRRRVQVFYEINFYQPEDSLQRTLPCERDVKLVPMTDKVVYIQYVELDGSPETVAANPTGIFISKQSVVPNKLTGGNDPCKDLEGEMK